MLRYKEEVRNSGTTTGGVDGTVSKQDRGPQDRDGS